MDRKRIPETDFFDRIAEQTSQPAPGEGAPAKLKSRIYSALMLHEAATGPLATFTETKRAGYQLCVFEELVRIAPVGEQIKSRNICRVCHARVLAESMDRAPIYWPHCPYSEFQKP